MKVFNLSILVLATAVLINGLWNSAEMENVALTTLETQSIKRMDELNGEYRRGERRFVEIKKEVKIEKKKIVAVKKVVAKKENKVLVKEFKLTEPVIREDADLQLVEYYNPKGSGKVLYQDQVIGQLVVRSGEIRDLSFSLDEDSQINLDSDEFKGNSFSYFAEGERFKGQIYPISRTAYMLTLTNGPHAGVRMKFQDPSTVFKKPASVEENMDSEENEESFDEESQEYASNDSETFGGGFKF